MGRVSYEKLKEMQNNPKKIRNISILAHVDHGKTSIADLLLATNAILSKRQAGMLRYLDNRPDEQRRGITMKSSTVSLCYTRETPQLEEEEEDFLVNIIDSPGHIDFASEVSAAARISDGTLIVVDVVEGVCAQTITALETAIREQTRMILILNKMDRLFLEKSMDTEEIYLHLTLLLETINACVADIKYKELSLQLEELGDLEQADDEFTPCLGNVIFASAIDGWAFRISDFAQIYSKQLGTSNTELIQYLWGDYYYDRKTKGFCCNAKELNKKPIFITMILENILALYENIIISKNNEKIVKIIEKLKLKNKTREMSSTDKRVQLRAIMSEWLPLADTVLSSVVDHIPSPANIATEKLNHILGKDIFNDDNSSSSSSTIEPFIKTCSTEPDAPIIAYVTKVYTIDRRNILSLDKRKIPTVIDIQAKREAVRKIKQALENKHEIDLTNHMIELKIEENKEEAGDEDDHLDFIACVRIFSGTLKLGDELYLVPTSATPEQNHENVLKIKIKIDELFMLLGKDVIKVEQSKAGNIIGIGNLKKYTIRTGTLSNIPDCTPLIESGDPVIEPFYKCAIEPKHISDMQALLQAVKLLIQSDSCAQCVLQENGQYVLMTAGHVHLEKCIEDLKTFTNVEFKMSSPMVQLRETLVLPMYKNEDREYESKPLLGMGVNISVFAYPMPTHLQQFIRENFALLKRIENHKSTAMKQLKEKMQQVFTEIGKKWEDVVDRILSIGDSGNDCCILVDLSKSKSTRHYSIFNNKTDASGPNDPLSATLYKHIINGFQLAIRAGPICDEPMKNILFYIKHLDVDLELFSSKCNAMQGVILKEMKVLVHKTFSLLQPRLMEPMYSARMTVDTMMMGKIQNRLDQYRGKITETYLVAKGLTDVEFVVPVLESADFCNKLRADTQGKISPLLHFSHFELMDQNPYNVPVATEDSDEDQIENNNIVNKLMNEVRKRKGLRVDEKIVDFAEKQRTLNKKK